MRTVTCYIRQAYQDVFVSLAPTRHFSLGVQLHSRPRQTGARSGVFKRKDLRERFIEDYNFIITVLGRYSVFVSRGINIADYFPSYLST